MMGCAACFSLIGKPSNVEPHSGLSIDVIIMKQDGEFIYYTCRFCEARWQRLNTKATFGAEPHYWTKR